LSLLSKKKNIDMPPDIPVQIRKGVLDEIFLQVQKHHEEQPGRETGGALIGIHNADVIEIMGFLPPGPMAVHRPGYFKEDREYQQRMLRAYQQNISENLSYLGDWHLHPFWLNQPSLGDYHTDRLALKETYGSAVDGLLIYPIVFKHHWWNADLSGKYVSNDNKWGIQFYYLTSDHPHRQFDPKIVSGECLILNVCNVDREIALLKVCSENLQISVEKKDKKYATLILTHPNWQVDLKISFPPEYPFLPPSVLVQKRGSFHEQKYDSEIIQNWSDKFNLTNFLYEFENS